ASAPAAAGSVRSETGADGDRSSDGSGTQAWSITAIATAAAATTADRAPAPAGTKRCRVIRRMLTSTCGGAHRVAARRSRARAANRSGGYLYYLYQRTAPHGEAPRVRIRQEREFSGATTGMNVIVARFAQSTSRGRRSAA